jgi:hypothetical protein
MGCKPSLYLVIEHNNKCIGLVRLTVNEQDKRARYGIEIHDINKLGKGFSTEATNLLLMSLSFIKWI